MGTGWIIYCLVVSLSFSDTKMTDPAANQLVDYKDSHVSYYIMCSKINNALLKAEINCRITTSDKLGFI